MIDIIALLDRPYSVIYFFSIKHPMIRLVFEIEICDLVRKGYLVINKDKVGLLKIESQDQIESILLDCANKSGGDLDLFFNNLSKYIDARFTKYIKNHDITRMIEHDLLQKEILRKNKNWFRSNLVITDAHRPYWNMVYTPDQKKLKERILRLLFKKWNGLEDIYTMLSDDFNSLFSKALEAHHPLYYLK